MLTKEEEDLIIFDIRFGDLTTGDLVKEQLTQRICNEMFTKVIGSIEPIEFLFTLMPIKFITQEMCNFVFETKLHLVSYLPEKLITQEMCDEAFKKYSWSIRYFPKKFITEEMKEKELNKHDI